MEGVAKAIKCLNRNRSIRGELGESARRRTSRVHAKKADSRLEQKL